MSRKVNDLISDLAYERDALATAGEGNVEVKIGVSGEFMIDHDLQGVLFRIVGIGFTDNDPREIVIEVQMEEEKKEWRHIGNA